MSVQELAQLAIAAATLISSLATLVSVVGTFRKVNQTHDLVNGQSRIVQELAQAKGFGLGVQEGITQERDRPPSK